MTEEQLKELEAFVSAQLPAGACVIVTRGSHGFPHTVDFDAACLYTAGLAPPGETDRPSFKFYGRSEVVRWLIATLGGARRYAEAQAEKRARLAFETRDFAVGLADRMNALEGELGR